jgi:hypothetical protein
VVRDLGPPNTRPGRVARGDEGAAGSYWLGELGAVLTTTTYLHGIIAG